MKKRRILLVEDEELITMLHTKYIEQIGDFYINSTDNGEDALIIAQKENPDLILMDIRINGNMNGINTAIELNKFLNTPILFITGSSEQSTLEKINSIKNSVGYLIKPIRREDLKKSFENIF